MVKNLVRKNKTLAKKKSNKKKCQEKQKLAQIFLANPQKNKWQKIGKQSSKKKLQKICQPKISQIKKNGKTEKKRQTVG